MNHYVVECEVDELEECLIMRCSTFHGASHMVDILSEAFPNAVFDVMEDEPHIHMRNYNPERYQALKEIIVGKQKNHGPQLIVINGGRA